MPGLRSHFGLRIPRSFVGLRYGLVAGDILTSINEKSAQNYHPYFSPFTRRFAHPPLSFLSLCPPPLYMYLRVRAPYKLAYRCSFRTPAPAVNFISANNLSAVFKVARNKEQRKGNPGIRDSELRLWAAHFVPNVFVSLCVSKRIFFLIEEL